MLRFSCRYFDAEFSMQRFRCKDFHAKTQPLVDRRNEDEEERCLPHLLLPLILRLLQVEEFGDAGARWLRRSLVRLEAFLTFGGSSHLLLPIRGSVCLYPCISRRRTISDWLSLHSQLRILNERSLHRRINKRLQLSLVHYLLRTQCVRDVFRETNRYC